VIETASGLGGGGVGSAEMPISGQAWERDAGFSERVVVIEMSNSRDSHGSILTWLIALAVVLLAFYGLDLLVMGIQGLPLNWDLTPVR
jgi:hypothetical protein